MSEENLELAKRAIDQWNRGERLPDEEIHPDAEIAGKVPGATLFWGRSRLTRVDHA